MMFDALWLVLATAIGAGVAPPALSSQGRDIVAVGVRYQAAADARVRQRDLEYMRRLRLTAVHIVQGRGRAAVVELQSLERLIAGEPDARLALAPDASLATVVVGPRGAEVSARAWTALAHGARAIIFDDWAALERHAGALVAVTDFAGEMARNAALYAPLRPRMSKNTPPAVRLDGHGGAVEAQFLESSEALVLIAINHGNRSRTVTMTFAPEMPEAIWQNMLTGTAVNFVAGKEGPTYTRAFEPQEVLVLMIRKKWR